MSSAKILIVEDEGIQALDLQQRLTNLGYTVAEIVSSGEEAIQKAGETSPDLVLMDIMLRGEIDGVAAAQKIQSLYDVPIIYITAYADEDTLQRAKITEPYGYIVKPIRERELHIIIDMALYKHRMQRELKESRNWLATTLKSIGDAVVTTDRNGAITFMNPVAEKLMGWKLEEATNKNLSDVFKIINSNSRKTVENPVEKVLREGLITGLANHTVLIAKDGKEVPIDDSAAPIKDDMGNIIGVILVFRDITERRKAEHAIYQAKLEWERTFNTIPDLVAILDSQHRIVLVNQAMALQLGTTPEQCIGLHCFECVHGLKQPPEFCPHAKTLQDGQEHIAEVHEDRLGGYFLVSTTPLRDESGKIVNSVHVARNITERKKAEESLKENERFLRHLAELNPAIITVTDLTSGKTVYSSRDSLTLLGYNRSEIKDFNAFAKSITYPGDYEKILSAYEEASRAKKDEVKQIEIRVKHADGQWRWYQIIYIISKRSDDGQPLQSMSFSMDITERKKIEAKNEEYAKHLEELVEERTKEVSNERQRLYSVLETLPVYVVLLDKDHHVPFANKFFCERFGESNGRRCFEYLFNRSEPCENCETYKVMQTHSPHHWEWVGPDKRNYDIYDFPFIEADGSRMILEMGIDITEQKHAHESLRSASQYVRSLIESSLDPLVTISADGRITDVNEATVRVTGVSREEIIGTDFSSYFTEPEKARAGYQRVFTEGSITNYPLTIRGKDGRLIEVLYNATVYRSEAGEVQGVFAAARDVTEYNALERKLKDSERLAAIGATAGMVGHDLRNPLQSVEGLVYLAREDMNSLPSDSPVRQSLHEALDAIEDRVGYMNKIVADLQDFVRPVTPQVEQVDVQRVVEGALSALTIPENITVETLIERDFGKIMLDPLLMVRVLNNLIINAVQAMPSGGKLTIKAQRKEESVLISVSDTGVGIPEEVKPKLFAPLFTTKSKGQGFGLPVCKRIVEAHKGEITFESVTGKGTTFNVSLPSTK